MPRYSLRQVLTRVSALCVALALAQLEFVSSCVCLVAFLVVLHFLVAVRICAVSPTERSSALSVAFWS